VPQIDIESFLRDLEAQKQRYEQIIEITIKQKGFIQNGNMDQAIKLVRQKQALLTEIDAIESKILGLKRNWVTIREGVPEHLRTRVQEIVDKTHDVLKGLIELEEEGRRMMQELQQQTSERLKGLWMQKRFEEIYRANKPEGPRFFDEGGT
jgi:hypothetical protein